MLSYWPPCCDGASMGKVRKGLRLRGFAKCTVGELTKVGKYDTY